MLDHTPVRLTAKAVREMTDEQWKSLRENVVGEGKWETARSVIGWMDGDGTLMVAPRNYEDEAMILIGIEPDGYTHS